MYFIVVQVVVSIFDDEEADSVGVAVLTFAVLGWDSGRDTAIVDVWLFEVVFIFIVVGTGVLCSIGSDVGWDGRMILVRLDLDVFVASGLAEVVIGLSVFDW